MTAPKTLREKFMQERELLYNERELLYSAQSQLASGQAASYSIGNRSVTYVSMKDLNDRLEYIEGKISDLEALLSGRGVRGVQVHSYATPALIQAPFFRYNNQ